MSSFAVCDADEQENFFSGSVKGDIYVWKGRTLQYVYNVHKNGFVSAMKYKNKQLLTGGKDCQVVISDPYAQSVTKSFTVASLPRGLDFDGSQIIAGLRCGTIWRISIEGGDLEKKFEAHN